MFFEAILGDHSKVSDVSRHYYLSPVTCLLDQHRDVLSCFGPFSFRNVPFFAAGGLIR